MSALSKFTASVPYDCYEVAHPWSHNCSYAWLYLFTSCIRESGKIYSFLYLFSQLVLSRKLSPEAFVQTVSSTARSTLFLSYNVFFFLFFICSFRRVEGRLYLPHSSFLSGLISSFLAIFLERPGRRQVLALYMLNLASEVLFNLLARRQIVPVIPHGDVLLFSIGLAGHAVLLSDSSRKDPVSSGLKFLIGTDIFAPVDRPKRPLNLNLTLSDGLRSFVKSFLIGYLGRCILSTATSLPKILANPSNAGGILLGIFTSEGHLNQGLFFGGAVASFRLIRTFLCHIPNVNDNFNRVFAGAMAGLWIGLSKNNSLTLYLFWKMVESSVSLGVQRGRIPNVPYGSELVYALSTAVLLFNAVMEPLNVRSSYLRFLSDITGTALERVNRHTVQLLGYASTEYRPSFFPLDVDLSKVHPRFIEMVAVWS